MFRISILSSLVFGLLFAACAKDEQPVERADENRVEQALEHEIAALFVPELHDEVIQIAWSEDLGWNFGTRALRAEDGVEPASLVEPLVHYDLSRVPGLTDEDIAKGRSARSGASRGFSGGTGRSSGFSSRSSATVTFSSSSGGRTGFQTSMRAGTCDIAEFCTALGDFVCTHEPSACAEVRQAVAECRAAASEFIEPEFRAFVCLIINILNCLMTAGDSEAAFNTCIIGLDLDASFFEFDDDDHGGPGDWDDTTDWDSWGPSTTSDFGGPGF